MSGKLTPKQNAFVLAYLETGNASEAYRRAYPTSQKWLASSVHPRASELLANSKVAARVEAEQARVAERHGVTIDRVIGEYAAIAFADAGEFFDWGPGRVTVREKSELTPQQRRVVAEVSQTVTESGGTIRVKLHDKLTALAQLSKHLGICADKSEVSHKLDASAAFLKMVQHISDRARPKAIEGRPA